MTVIRQGIGQNMTYVVDDTSYCMFRCTPLGFHLLMSPTQYECELDIASRNIHPWCLQNLHNTYGAGACALIHKGCLVVSIWPNFPLSAGLPDCLTSFFPSSLAALPYLVKDR